MGKVVLPSTAKTSLLSTLTSYLTISGEVDIIPAFTKVFNEIKDDKFAVDISDVEMYSIIMDTTDKYEKEIRELLKNFAFTVIINAGGFKEADDAKSPSETNDYLGVKDSEKPPKINDSLQKQIVKKSSKRTDDAPQMTFTLDENYPETTGYVDDKLNMVKINKEKGEAIIHHQSGSYVRIDINGNMELYTKGNFTHFVEKDYTLNVKGNMDFIVSNDLFLKSENSNFNFNTYNFYSKDYTEDIVTKTSNISKENENVLSKESNISGWEINSDSYVLDVPIANFLGDFKVEGFER